MVPRIGDALLARALEVQLRVASTRMQSETYLAVLERALIVDKTLPNANGLLQLLNVAVAMKLEHKFWLRGPLERFTAVVPFCECLHDAAQLLVLAVRLLGFDLCFLNK